MNANSKQPAPKIELWLRDATAQLKTAGIPTARLDAELILAYALDVKRTWLLAHSDELITDTLLPEGRTFPVLRGDTNAPLEPSKPDGSNVSVIERIDSLLEKRLQRTPLAYITGHKEFYGRNFTVTPDVLIPRPETEKIIEQLKLLNPVTGQRLIDVGTGSGAIAITTALEFPDLDIEATDISTAALHIARKNADTLQASVDFYESNLLANAKNSYDFILTNLPYVDTAWERSPETNYEPDLALFADDHGLDLIKQCTKQATTRLRKSGYLLLEADPVQHGMIIETAVDLGFIHLHSDDYIVTLQC